jgi:hypothetical protein
VAAAALLTLSAGTNAAPILYVGDINGALGTVDVATGASAVIGNMGSQMTDIAFDGAGNLWAITFSQLFSVDKNSAAATLVGSLGVGTANALTFGSDGTLYMAGGTGFYTVNTATGAATLVGNTGAQSSGDLAFRNGTLYLTAGSSGFDSLYSINTATGAGTLIGTNLGVTDMFGLATPDNNVVYGTAGKSIFGINTATGTATFMVSWGGELQLAYGAAFVSEAVVPEPSTYALMLAGLGLLGFAARRRRA